MVASCGMKQRHRRLTSNTTGQHNIHLRASRNRLNKPERRFILPVLHPIIQSIHIVHFLIEFWRMIGLNSPSPEFDNWYQSNLTAINPVRDSSTLLKTNRKLQSQSDLVESLNKTKIEWLIALLSWTTFFLNDCLLVKIPFYELFSMGDSKPDFKTWNNDWRWSSHNLNEIYTQVLTLSIV